MGRTVPKQRSFRGSLYEQKQINAIALLVAKLNEMDVADDEVVWAIKTLEGFIEHPAFRDAIDLVMGDDDGQ